MKNQNGGYIQGRKCLYFSPNFMKNDIFVPFSFVLFVLGKNKTFMIFFFLENSK
jgi:hypothetical protein